MYAKGTFLRAPGNYDADEVSLASGVSIDPEDPQENQAQQQFKEECDINTIVERFGLTGELPQTVGMPVSGDFTGITDFHSAMNLVTQAEAAFMELPAKIRARFQNDPGQALAFLDNPENRAEAIELGLVEKPPEKTRDAVQAIDELAKSLQAQPVVTPLA